MTDTYYILGPPGTGKTQSIAKNVARAMDRYGPRGVLVCSLTKAAAREAAGRVPLPRQQVGTLHSLCYHALGRPTVAELKLDEWNQAHPTLMLERDKMSLDEPQPEVIQAASPAARMLAKLNILRARKIPKDIWPDDSLRFWYRWQQWKKDNDYLDFTDLLEQAPPVAPGYPQVIFVDEHQDSSPLEYDLVQRWGRQSAQVVFVGDPYQNLYNFRGSDSVRVFPDNLDPSQNSQVKVLRQSYRVPRAVHARATEWISKMPGYQAVGWEPTASEGEVDDRFKAVWQDPERILGVVADHPDETVMIMASCAYMLEPTLTLLRQCGIAFCNPWRQTSGKWNPLAKRAGSTLPARLLSFLRPWKAAWGDEARFWTPQDLSSWSQVLQADMTWVRGGKSKVLKLADDETAAQGDVVEAINNLMLESARLKLPGPEVPMLKAAEWWIERLMPQYKQRIDYPLAVLKNQGSAGLTQMPKVIVGTIHSLKGSEADRVIVFPDLSVAGWQTWESQARDSIYRQFYVALTRARKAVHIAKFSGLGVRL